MPSCDRIRRKGLHGLVILRRFGLGACLADDMGLGKTIQFITYLLHIKDHEPRSRDKPRFTPDLPDLRTGQLAKGN